jgi:surface polysaccharide O-acyltransferase-like enzyme
LGAGQLHEIWGTTMTQDYVIGTYFFGVGVVVMALSNTNLLRFSTVASVGPLVLGIYVSHIMFIEFLVPLKRQLSGNTIWDILFLALVFMLSYAFSLTLSKFFVTKRLVV